MSNARTSPRIRREARAATIGSPWRAGGHPQDAVTIRIYQFAGKACRGRLARALHVVQPTEGNSMENTTDKSPFDVAVQAETEAIVLATLDEVESRLAAQLGIPRRSLRRRLLPLLRSGAVAEDELVSRWLAAYHTAMEYAAERASGPPRNLRGMDEQGPHEAALAAFGA